ncbi:MAG TPA: hypothetical protein VOA88_03095 [Candidatus Dormibacteraeota bacterium]|nr:hypothetical protein [Candidatus Dormibacteraeota bacterium]
MKGFLIGGGIATPDDNVWRKPGYKLGRGIWIELDREIHGAQGSDNFSALGGRRYRQTGQPGLSLATLARLRFALDSYHKDISVRASLFDKANVPGVQQVESAAGEHDSLPVAFPLDASENQFILRNYATQISALPVHYDDWLQTHHSNMRVKMAGAKR